jgi:PAS domain S-box-containing protein
MSRLLIVDDKEEERYLLKVLFEKSGYRVDVANDGAQALAIARNDPPDMIVSDILMPVMDGFSLCREWRKDKLLRFVSFVFYTATYTDPRDEGFALKLGADKFIVKPTEPAALLQMIEEVLANRSQHGVLLQSEPPTDDAMYFKSYSESLVRKLEDKLELFHTIFDIDPSAIFMLSPSNLILELNRAALQLCGVRAEEALDMDFVGSFIPDLSRIVFIQRMQETLSGSPKLNFESALRTADRSERTLLWNAQRLTNSSGAIVGVLLIGTDITERLHAERQRTMLETQLRQAQKMEALGAFASGIAHDFNNILTGIIGFIDLSRYAASPGSEIQEHLQNALIAANRAKDLVSQILSISRGGKEVFKPVEITPLIKEAELLLRASIPSSIDITIDIGKDCGSILCDPTQIHQVLMNLCTNAYHAIGSGNGAIAISCRCLDEKVTVDAAEPDLIPGTHVVIEVTDTGIGMSKATLSRIFDPYFTTKEKGKGTGLGLAVVKAIVHAHNGKIQVESSEGKGSIFRVFFPKQETRAPKRRLVGSGAWEIGNNESVLLVEDNEIAGPMLVDALTMLKYRVNLVSNGMEAYELFMRNPHCCDILMTDFTMPKMGGLELTRKVHELRPMVPVVLMSGSSEALAKPLLESLGINSFLKKPFDLGELSRALKGIGKKNT